MPPLTTIIQYVGPASEVVGFNSQLEVLTILKLRGQGLSAAPFQRQGQNNSHGFLYDYMSHRRTGWIFKYNYCI